MNYFLKKLSTFGVNVSFVDHIQIGVHKNSTIICIENPVPNKKVVAHITCIIGNISFCQHIIFKLPTN